MNSAYVAEPPTASPFSTSKTDPPRCTARAAAARPAMPPPRTRRSTFSKSIFAEVSSVQLDCPAMRVGMLLNVNNHTVDPATLASAVEEAGFESLWVGDHP